MINFRNYLINEELEIENTKITITKPFGTIDITYTYSGNITDISDRIQYFLSTLDLSRPMLKIIETINVIDEGFIKYIQSLEFRKKVEKVLYSNHLFINEITDKAEYEEENIKALLDNDDDDDNLFYYFDDIILKYLEKEIKNNIKKNNKYITSISKLGVLNDY